MTTSQLPADPDPDDVSRGLAAFEQYLDRVARFQAWVEQHGDPKPEPTDEEWRELTRDDDEPEDA